MAEVSDSPESKGAQMSRTFIVTIIFVAVEIFSLTTMPRIYILFNYKAKGQSI